MTRIVINTCFGGFSLSQRAAEMLAKRKEGTVSTHPGIERDDADLLAVIDSIGVEAASGGLAELKVVEVPDDVNWEIYDYDGVESVIDLRGRWS